MRMFGQLRKTLTATILLVLFVCRVNADIVYVTTPTNITQIANDGTVSVFLGPLNVPLGLTIDHAGNLYADSQFSNDILKIAPDASTSIIPGGPVTSGEFQGLAVDLSDNLYVAGTQLGSVIKITPEGIKSDIANGLNRPLAVTTDRFGNVWVSTERDKLIQKITPAGVVSLFASLNSAATGLAFGADGNLYASTPFDNVILSITPNGNVSTFATISNPIALAFESSGALDVLQGGQSGSIERLERNGIATVIASNLYYPDDMAIRSIPEPASITTFSLIGLGFVPRSGFRKIRSRN